MNNPKCYLCRFAAVIAVGLVLALAAIAIKRQLAKPAAGAPRPPVPALAVTPPIPAGPNDLFEDVTIKAGINFVHQFCDTKIANILESNGAGGCWLDYDGDGLMDLFLVNSGPLDGVTHHVPGTPCEGPRLYRNRGDGTFEDVTKKAGLGGMAA